MKDIVKISLSAAIAAGLVIPATLIIEDDPEPPLISSESVHVTWEPYSDPKADQFVFYAANPGSENWVEISRCDVSERSWKLPFTAFMKEIAMSAFVSRTGEESQFSNIIFLAALRIETSTDLRNWQHAGWYWIDEDQPATRQRFWRLEF